MEGAGRHSASLALGSLALLGVVALAIRSRLLSSDGSLSPESCKAKKKKVKGRKPKPVENLELATQQERDVMHDFHEVRRAASTMTSATIAWFKQNIEMLLSPGSSPAAAAAVEVELEGERDSDGARCLNGEADAACEGDAPKPAADSITVLSIGCGDGVIDIEVLKAIAAQPGVTKVHYVGIEPSASAAAAFRARLSEARESKQIGPDVVAFVLETSLDDRPVRSSPNSPTAGGAGARGFQSKHEFDLVLLVHAVHCFKSPLGAIQRALLQTRPGGRIVVLQPASSGITQVSAELSGAGEPLYFTADELKRLLVQHRLQHAIDSFETHIDVTHCLTRTAKGVQVMSDCLQRDLRKAKEAKMMRVLKAFWRVATIDPEDGTAHVKEPVSAFILEKALAPSGGH